MSGLEITLITAAISTLGFAPLIWHKAINPLFNKTRKLFKPKPKYEPAGIIHYGEFRFGDYYAIATPHGTHHVWHHNEYLGEYRGQRIEIVEHLHAKDQK